MCIHLRDGPDPLPTADNIIEEKEVFYFTPVRPINHIKFDVKLFKQMEEV